MSRAESPLHGRLIFLVGARRSGTNWLGRVIGAHPDVVAVPAETHLFSHGIRPLADRVHHGPASSNRTGSIYMDREEFLDGLRDLVDRIFAGLYDALRHDEPLDGRLLERTPWHAFALDLIGAVYPDAFVVHMVRDGRDVGRSLVAQDWGPDRISDAAEEWRSTIQSVRRAASDIPDPRFIEVRYEELLRDPRSLVPDVYSRLGLPAGDQIVDVALAEAGVHFNVDPGSPRVQAGKWREEWSAREIREFERVAGGTLDELGYERAVPVSKFGARGRQVRARIRSRVRRRGRGDVERAVLSRLNDVQVVIDEFFDLLATRRFRQIGELLHPNANLRVVTGRRSWSGRGVEAAAEMEQALAADPALSGRQVTGDLHTALPTSTVVLVYETPEGLERRAFTIALEGSRIAELTFYGAERPQV